MQQIEIVTLQDIKEKIPADRLDAFLADLKQWVLMPDQGLVDGYHKVLESVAASLGLDAKVELKKRETMVWVDDGQVGLSSISVHVGDTPIQTLHIKRENQ